jgi:hypothetical protein
VAHERILGSFGHYQVRGDRKDYEVQKNFENCCIYKKPVTVIVHEIDIINKMLSEGQYFFTDIEKKGILLYDAGKVLLTECKTHGTRNTFIRE